MADPEYPPLVTGRSPSNLRAQEERAHPTPTTDANVMAALHLLVELEENERRACADASETVRAPRLAALLAAEVAAHEERRRELCEVIERLGGAPPRREECRWLVRHGGIAAHMTDAEIQTELAAMRDEVRRAQEVALAHPGVREALAGSRH